MKVDLFFIELMLLILVLRGCGGYEISDDSVNKIVKELQVKK